MTTKNVQSSFSWVSLMRSDCKFTRAAHTIKISSNSFKDVTVPLIILNTLSLWMALSRWMCTLAIPLVNVTSSAPNWGLFFVNAGMLSITRKEQVIYSKTTVCHNLISWEQIIHEASFFNNKFITGTTTESVGYEHYLSMWGYYN